MSTPVNNQQILMGTIQLMLSDQVVQHIQEDPLMVKDINRMVPTDTHYPWQKKIILTFQKDFLNQFSLGPSSDRMMKADLLLKSMNVLDLTKSGKRHINNYQIRNLFIQTISKQYKAIHSSVEACLIPDKAYLLYVPDGSHLGHKRDFWILIGSEVIAGRMAFSNRADPEFMKKIFIHFVTALSVSLNDASAPKTVNSPKPSSVPVPDQNPKPTEQEPAWKKAWKRELERIEAENKRKEQQRQEELKRQKERERIEEENRRKEQQRLEELERQKERERIEAEMHRAAQEEAEQESRSLTRQLADFQAVLTTTQNTVLRQLTEVQHQTLDQNMLLEKVLAQSTAADTPASFDSSDLFHQFNELKQWRERHGWIEEFSAASQAFQWMEEAEKTMNAAQSKERQALEHAGVLEDGLRNAMSRAYQLEQTVEHQKQSLAEQERLIQQVSSLIHHQQAADAQNNAQHQQDLLRQMEELDQTLKFKQQELGKLSFFSMGKKKRLQAEIQELTNKRSSLEQTQKTVQSVIQENEAQRANNLEQLNLQFSQLQQELTDRTGILKHTREEIRDSVQAMQDNQDRYAQSLADMNQVCEDLMSQVIEPLNQQAADMTGMQMLFVNRQLKAAQAAAMDSTESEDHDSGGSSDQTGRSLLSMEEPADQKDAHQDPDSDRPIDSQCIDSPGEDRVVSPFSAPAHASELPNESSQNGGSAIQETARENLIHESQEQAISAEGSVPHAPHPIVSPVSSIQPAASKDLLPEEGPAARLIERYQQAELDTQEEMLTGILYYKESTCRFPEIRDFMEGKPLSEAKQIADVLLEHTLPEGKDYLSIQVHRCQKNPAFIQEGFEYLNHHDFQTQRRGQNVLYTVLSSMLRDDFTTPAAYHSAIDSMEEPPYELAKVTAEYYSMIGQYPTAQRMLQKLETAISQRTFLFKESEAYAARELDRLQKSLTRYQSGKPYWPKTEERRRQLVPFYQQAGIPLPGNIHLSSTSRKIREADFLPLNISHSMEVNDYVAFHIRYLSSPFAPEEPYEIAAVRVHNGNIDERFYRTIEPFSGAEYRNRAAKKLGITTQELSQSSPLDQTMMEFLRFSQGLPLIAAEALTSMGRALIRIARYSGRDHIDNPVIDLLDYAASISPQYDFLNHGRAQLLDHWNLSHQEDAQVQAENTYRMYEALKTERNNYSSSDQGPSQEDEKSREAEGGHSAIAGCDASMESGHHQSNLEVNHSAEPASNQFQDDQQGSRLTEYLTQEHTRLMMQEPENIPPLGFLEPCIKETDGVPESPEGTGPRTEPFDQKKPSSTTNPSIGQVIPLAEPSAAANHAGNADGSDSLSSNRPDEISYTPEQLAAIQCDQGNVRIIACAGSGKTETIAQRTAYLLQSVPGLEPKHCVAFTFTRKAAAELYDRVTRKLPNQDLSAMYIGTIHSFCWDMLTKYCPRFKDYQILDEVKCYLFLDRYKQQAGFEKLGLAVSAWNIKRLQSAVERVILMKAEQREVDPALEEVFENYRSLLEDHHYLDFNLMIAEMLEGMNNNAALRQALADIQYLTVDEYQDTDAGQQALVQAIERNGTKICVVGDDDQTIYRFRHSDPKFIIEFDSTFPQVQSFTLSTNFRSSTKIVETASRFIMNNENRLPKAMSAAAGMPAGEITIESFPALETELEHMAHQIKMIRKEEPQATIAVLTRKRKWIPFIEQVLRKQEISFHTASTDHFFESELYELFESLIREMRTPDKAALYGLLEGYVSQEGFQRGFQNIRIILLNPAARDHRSISEFLEEVLETMDFFTGPEQDTRKRIWNNFSAILNDFEEVYQDCQLSYQIRELSYFLEHNAAREYRFYPFEEGTIQADAVDILTVHKAKGLEFDYVLIPNLNKGEFPGRFRREAEDLLLSEEEARTRFMEDERRLFYVAMTRAKKKLILSFNHEKPRRICSNAEPDTQPVRVQTVAGLENASPFIRELLIKEQNLVISSSDGTHRNPLNESAE